MKKEYKDEICSELPFLWIFIYEVFYFGFYIFDKCIILNSQFSFRGGCSTLENNARVFELFALVLRREMWLIHNPLGSS